MTIKNLLFSNSIKGLLIHLLIMVFIGVLLSLGFFYVYLPGFTNKGDTITVPSLVERNYNELEEILLNRDLTYEISDDSIYSATHPPLTILRQYPKEGSKVKEGRKIILTLSRRTVPTVALTQISGKSLTHIKLVLENNDIKINKLISRSHPHFNLVLEILYNGAALQEGDLVPKGAVVDIVVADGAGKHSFPLADFFGLPFEEAEVLRKGMDLNLEPLNLPPGKDTTNQTLYIIRQDPLPETTVNIGDGVKFWLDTEIDSTFYHEIHPDTVIQTNDPGIITDI